MVMPDACQPLEQCPLAWRLCRLCLPGMLISARRRLAVVAVLLGLSVVLPLGNWGKVLNSGHAAL